MQKTISRFIYFFISATLIVVGLIVKLFLVDTDIGARFKNFNHRLLASDILLSYALFLGIIGLIFYAIKKSRKATLKDTTIMISAFLIIPLSLVLALTPILETFYPGESGESVLSSVFSYTAILGTFAAFAWIILLLITILSQTFIILSNKDK